MIGGAWTGFPAEFENSRQGGPRIHYEPAPHLERGHPETLDGVVEISGKSGISSLGCLLFEA